MVVLFERTNEVLLQELRPRLNWRDVVRINESSFTSQEYDKIVQSLNEIENTTSGQTLLYALQSSNAEEGVVVMGRTSENSNYNPALRIVRIGENAISNIRYVHFDENGNPFQDGLTGTVYHELAHAVDARLRDGLMLERKLYNDQIQDITKQYDLTIGDPENRYYVEGNEEFMATLTPEQLNALEEMQQTAKNLSDDELRNPRLFEEYIPVLIDNPIIGELIEIEREMTNNIYEVELPVVRATNIFNQELSDGIIPNRAGYMASFEYDAQQNPKLDNVSDAAREAARVEAQRLENEDRSPISRPLEFLRIQDLNPHIPEAVRRAIETSPQIIDVPPEGATPALLNQVSSLNINIGSNPQHLDNNNIVSPNNSVANQRNQTISIV
jgi:hypothetical protein